MKILDPEFHEIEDYFNDIRLDPETGCYSWQGRQRRTERLRHRQHSRAYPARPIRDRVGIRRMVRSPMA